MAWDPPSKEPPPRPTFKPDRPWWQTTLFVIAATGSLILLLLVLQWGFAP